MTKKRDDVECDCEVCKAFDKVLKETTITDPDEKHWIRQVVNAKLNVAEVMMSAEESGFDFDETPRMEVADSVINAIIESHQEPGFIAKNTH